MKQLKLTICIFILASSIASVKAKVLPKAPIAYDSYETPELVQLVDDLRKFHRHIEAIEAGNEALRKLLSPGQDAFVRYKMAQSYEFVQNGGLLAKEKYDEVLKLHSNYERNVEIAYRLGELNSCIIMRGTEPNAPEAIECFEYVLDRLVDPNKSNGKVYYIALKAHMGLGNLQWDRKNYATAKRHFESIYKCDIELAEPLPCEKFEDPNELAEHKTWLKNLILSMKTRIPTKLVGLCIRPDPVESMNELDNLMTEYADDAAVVQLAREAYNQVCAVDEIIDDAIDDFEQ